MLTSYFMYFVCPLNMDQLYNNNATKGEGKGEGEGYPIYEMLQPGQRKNLHSRVNSIRANGSRGQLFNVG